MNLVRAQQGIVDAFDHARHGIDGIEALIRVHLAGGIGVAGDLPTGTVDRLEAGLHGLHRLIAGHAPEGADHGLGLQLPPELFSTQASERMLDMDRPAQA